ncbi:hypothetical protein AB434_0552 [Heyndrickxia coagulans]|uniref:Uncharacterized protein n=1 Tax=Heyndrickxia coagulans TaxID=1398 RepID=A0AAN0WAJ7_HEYCO|nr:hypothetical protein SB48_HM08orf00956 [Heyndrickxia coagulans]AKN52957.1 hypothetical protein AB434_0552 [Heyndrickxia coagulans]
MFTRGSHQPVTTFGTAPFWDRKRFKKHSCLKGNPKISICRCEVL